MRSRMLFVHALSPLHVGTGQAVGAVDLPVARERATGYPYLPGSGLKGCMRARAIELNQKDVEAVFGPATDRASEHAGALAVGDAGLLLLPIRSIAGTFAYVTSPWLLARFARDAQEAGVKGVPPIVPQCPSQESCGVAASTVLTVKVGATTKVVFEDLDLSPGAADAQKGVVKEWAEFLSRQIFPKDSGDDVWRQLLVKRFCLVHDDVMSYFSLHGTDVVTRVRINHDKGTAEKGGLWSEESLPVESVLASLLVAQAVKGVAAAKVFEAVQEIAKGSMQLGGKASVGRGRCRLVLSGGAA